MEAWHNEVVTIPLDFELKIGKDRIKHAKKTATIKELTLNNANG